MPFTPSNRTITAPSGSSVIKFGRNTPAAAPVAEFIGAPVSGTAPLAVTFTDQSTGTVSSWAWDFGDGQTSTSQNPTHVYAAAGVYTVTLTVEGPGGSDSRARTAYINAAGVNLPPNWNGVGPTSLGTFSSGVQSTVALSAYATDPEGDQMYFARTGGAEDTAPAGVTVSQAGLLTIPDDLPDGNYSITVDVSASPASAIAELQLVGGGDGVPWSFGQVFSQGDAPLWVDMVALEGTLSAYQVDVRNRWSDGSVKFAVLSGIGATRVEIRSTATEPAAGSVALGTVAASVTISGVADYLGAPLLTGPVTVTMPNSGAAATFGADPASHVAGLVRTIPGPVMTEYHYYSPVAGEPHLAVWWYVRAYSNGAREVETMVECTPWVTVNGGGRRDYAASVSVGGIVRLSGFPVVAYAHTRWSRVDWAGSPHVVAPRHDSAYLREFAFPYSNLPAPSGATNAIYGGDGLTPLAYNDYATAMAPPINNPESKLDWANRIGATGTSGSLRTLWESAYAAGADCYWTAEAHARTAGRWDRIVRDPATGRAFDTMAPGNTSQVGVAAFTGDRYNDGVVNNSFSASHAPPLGSGAYLLSGRWPFMEHMQMCAHATVLTLANTDTRRSGYRLGGPYGPTSITPDVRQGAWMQWGYMNCLTWTPEYIGNGAPPAADAAMRLSFTPYVEQFAAGLLAAFRDGTSEGGIYQNALGIVGWSPGYLGSYEDTAFAWGDSFMQNYICFVLAAGLQLDLPISTAGATDLAALAQFAMRRVVELGGTNAGWNYRRPYIHLPYGPDEAGGSPAMPPSTWFSTWAEVWAAAATSLTIPADTSDADGQQIFKFRGATATPPWDPREYLDRTEYSYGDNYLKQWSALALAVDLAVPGAAAAWARLQSSPTMQDPRTADNLRNFPVTVFTPRSLG